MRSMRDRYELTGDGPYVRVVLPDVLPPDWDALEREIDEEVEDGATKVMVMAADERTLDTHRERLSALVSQLRADGIDTVVVWQDDAVVVA
jgi:hypothetical protein